MSQVINITLENFTLTKMLTYGLQDSEKNKNNKLYPQNPWFSSLWRPKQYLVVAPVSLHLWKSLSTVLWNENNYYQQAAAAKKSTHQVGYELFFKRMLSYFELVDE